MPHLSREVNQSSTAYVLCLALLAGCSTAPIKKQTVVLAYPAAPEQARFYYERTFRTSHDVQEKTAADRFKAFVTGAINTGYGLAKPYGVAVYQGRIYVSDTVQRAVFMFDVPGKNFKIIGTEGPGTLTKPIGITVSRKGELFVADHTAKRIVIYDKDGNYLRAIGGSEHLLKPSGIAVSPDSTKVYVVDTGGVEDQAHHRVVVFNAQTGEMLTTIGSRGIQDGQFNLPLQAATAPDGTLYVVDGGNFRVQAFTAEGTFIRSIGSVGRKSGQFSRPKGIGTDPDGNIYVVDTAFGNFQIFDSAGQLLLYVGDRGYKGNPGEYMLPAGIFVDEDGRIYIVDQFFKKIDVYRPAKLQPDEGWLSSKLKKKE